MAKTFHPELYELVPASPPHPDNTHYKVSIGLEQWGGAYIPVVKVQMVYEGKISGRKPPSYPLGTDDYARVHKAIEDLVHKRYQNIVAEQQATYHASAND